MFDPFIGGNDGEHKDVDVLKNSIIFPMQDNFSLVGYDLTVDSFGH